MSAFEVLGPIMVVLLPRTQLEPCALPWLHVHLHQQLERVEFLAYNSFSHTHLWSRQPDYALIAESCGLAPDDTRP